MDKLQLSPIDKALYDVGYFGSAQYFMILTNIFVQIFVGWPAVISVFFAIDVPFRCQNLNYSQHTLIGLRSFSQLSSNFDNQCRENCEKYIYESSPSSIVSDFDLACGSRPTLTSAAVSAFWFGFFLSCFASGPLSDGVGRRLTSLVSCSFYLIISGTYLVEDCTTN